jgi:hypothetical protein
MASPEEIAIEKYKLLFELWTSENSVKTNKLQMLMATNAILVSALTLAQRPVLWIALAGFVFSLVWILSIGRTVGYQEHWKVLMDEIRKQYGSNALFQTHSTQTALPVWGRVSSKYYLIGTPIATTIAWLSVIVFTLVRG